MNTRQDLLTKLSGSYWGTGVTFQRSNPVPLDKYSVFGTLADAQEYAFNNAVAYPGQTLAVITDTNNVTLYIIQAGATSKETSLKEVGSATLGDGLSVELTSAGVLKLKDFGTQYYAYNTEDQAYNSTPTQGWKAGLQPQVKVGEDGYHTLAWYEPNPTTVEGLAGQIGSLSQTVGTMESQYSTTKQEVSTLKTDVSNLKTSSEAHDDKIEALEGKVSALESADVYTKTETDNKIAEEIAKKTHMSTQVVSSTDEMTEENIIYLVKDPDASGVDKYLQYLVINGQATCVGDTSVDLTGYATEAWVTNKGYATAEAMDSADSTLQSNINAVNAKFDNYTTTADLNTTLANYDTSTQVNAKVKVATDKATENAGKIATNTDNIEALEGALAATNQNVSKNAQGVTDVNTRVDNVVNDITAVNTRIDNLGTTYATDTELAAVKTEIEKTIEGLEGDIANAALATNVYTKTETNNKIAEEIGKLDKVDTAVDNQFVTSVSEEDGIVSVTRRQPVAADISDFSAAADARVSIEKERAEGAEGALADRITPLETAVTTTIPNTYAKQTDLDAVSDVADKAASDVSTLAGTVSTLSGTVSELSETHSADKAELDAKFSNYVPTTRKVNGQALNADITLTPELIGADPEGTGADEAAAALTEANKYTDAEIDKIESAYTAADSGLANRITAIENSYVKHSVDTIEYILDCGTSATR